MAVMEMTPLCQSNRIAVACCVLGLVAGCGSKDDSDQPATTRPTADTQPTEQPRQQSVILPQSQSWSCEEALAKLDDESAAVSAAVRLVRLSAAAPLGVPDPLPARIATRLRVLRLSDALWALGWSVAGHENRLRSAVLIGSAGEVELPVSGTEEEFSLLYVSDDVDVFPHLLITPLRVLIVAAPVQPAIMAKSLGDSRFAMRHERGFPYVALVCSGAAEAEGDQEPPAEPVEVARYAWDPYEMSFMGPAADKLPDPPGGRFEIDLKQSPALVPVGGEIAKPDPVEEYIPPEERERDGELPPY
jgi:hypothetical protein